MTLIAILARTGMAAPGIVELHLCVPADEPRLRGTTENLSTAVQRLSYSGYVQLNKEIRVSLDRSDTCHEIAGNSCYGTEGRVYCNGLALARLLESIAWVSSSIALSVVGDVDDEASTGIIASPEIGVEAGLMLSDAVATGRPEYIRDAMRRAAEHYQFSDQALGRLTVTMPGLLAYDRNPSSRLDETEVAVYVAYTVYEAALNYVFAYVLGHELAHAFQTCIHNEASEVEKSGMLKDLVLIQARGEVVCPNSPLLDEVLADRCALRATQRMDAEMTAYKEQHSQSMAEQRMHMALLSFGRRLAIDSLSLLLMTGLGERADDIMHWVGSTQDGLPVLAYVSQPRPGYLYAPIRLALFASLLNALAVDHRDFVRICSASAQRFVLGLNFARVYCEAGRTRDIDHSGLPEIFGSFVPAGVVAGWRTGNWDDRTSFACDIEHSHGTQPSEPE